MAVALTSNLLCFSHRRHMIRLILALALLLAVAPFADARNHSSSSHPRSSRALARPTKSKLTRCASCSRDSSGHIARSRAATRQFKKANPCPSTGRRSGACPGYVIDHVTPLKRGGADTPGNMQWQTKAAARAKDKVE